MPPSKVQLAQWRTRRSCGILAAGAFALNASGSTDRLQVAVSHLPHAFASLVAAQRSLGAQGEKLLGCGTNVGPKAVATPASHASSAAAAGSQAWSPVWIGAAACMMAASLTSVTTSSLRRLPKRLMTARLAGSSGSSSEEHQAEDMKYILISGGICSSLGKGVVTSSIGALLRAAGYRITAVKVDPYLNVDAGLMSPREHGEVYVLDDGGEADLDMGNYERLMGLHLCREHNITGGKIFQDIIEKERRGGFLGKTVTWMNITKTITDWVEDVAQKCVDRSGEKPQVCLIELGGTVGDDEQGPFLEAFRRFQQRQRRTDSMVWFHLTHIPVMRGDGQKSKPTQHSATTLLSYGIGADFIVCRCEEEIALPVRRKIADHCNIPENCVLSSVDQKNLFHVVGAFADQGVVPLLEEKLRLDLLKKGTALPGVWSLSRWAEYAKSVDTAEESKEDEVVIGIVGKYMRDTGSEDAYKSVVNALRHSSVELQRKLQIMWVDAQEDDEGWKARMEEDLQKCHGILVPGGFGTSGTDQKAWATHLARVWKKPFLGICLGMQVSLIQLARDIGIEDATSAEFDSDDSHVDSHIFKFMPEIRLDTMGANMRLGARWVEFTSPDKSVASALYGGASRIKERHRHRYEFNTQFKEKMEGHKMCFVGQDAKKERMDVIELHPDEHPFYVGVQFHPELKSQPGRPAPLFHGFVAAACGPEILKDVVEKRRAKGPDSHWVPPDED